MTIRFVFVPTRTAGAPEEGQPKFELRSIPGNLIGAGDSPHEAASQLVGLISWTMKEEPSFQDWYREAWSYAGPGDEAEFDSITAHQVRKLQNPKPIDGQVGYSLVAS